jgi:hypothetical protein
MEKLFFSRKNATYAIPLQQPELKQQPNQKK